VVPNLTACNRLTTGFRLILALPHLILVGGLGVGGASRGEWTSTSVGEGGLLGAAAAISESVRLGGALASKRTCC